MDKMDFPELIKTELIKTELIKTELIKTKESDSIKTNNISNDYKNIIHTNNIFIKEDSLPEGYIILKENSIQPNKLNISVEEKEDFIIIF
jgi:hypothetical protein